MPPASEGRPRLGALLTRLGLIDETQVNDALGHQAKTGRFFGETLVDLGYVSEDDLTWALSSQLQLPFVAVTADMVDGDVLARFPPDFLRRHSVVPLVASGNSLSVVLADPTDEPAMARLRQISQCSLDIAVGTPTAIQRVLDTLLGRAKRGGGGSVSDSVGAQTNGPPPPSEVLAGLERARAAGAEALYFDAVADRVRIRMRVGGTLQEQGTMRREEFDSVLGNLEGWLGRGHEDAPGLRCWSDADRVHGVLRAIMTDGAVGTSLALVLQAAQPGGSDGGAGDEPEEERAQSLTEQSRGLLVTVAPTRAERAASLQRLVRGVDPHQRRAWAVTDRPIAEGFLHAPAGGGPVLEVLLQAEGVEVVAAMFDTLSVVPVLAEAASRDRLVVAALPGNGALGFLAHVLEQGTSPLLLADALLAVGGHRWLPTGLPAHRVRRVAEWLFVDAPLRRVLRDGARPSDVWAAAREQGFVELAERLRRSEAVSPRHLADLERHAFLGSGA